MNTTSTLEAVTVYRAGAVCTRRARLDGAVPTSVRVVGLPLSLSPGSVRARVVGGPPGLQVLDVRPGFDVTFGDAIDESAETKARDAAHLEVQRLEAAAQRADAEVRELQGLRARRFSPEEGAPPRPTPIDAVLALAGFVDDRLRALLADKRAVERQLRDAKEALTLAERRLGEASQTQRTQKAQVTRAVAVTLSERAAGPVELELEYQVPGVRWVPSYALRLDRGLTGGTLRMRASVVQDTGEDWRGVALSLSTATLLRRTDAPELKSLRVGRAQATPAKPGFRAPPPGLDELFDAYDASARKRASGPGGTGGRPPAPRSHTRATAPAPSPTTGAHLKRAALKEPDEALEAQLAPPTPADDDESSDGAALEMVRAQASRPPPAPARKRAPGAFVRPAPAAPTAMATRAPGGPRGGGASPHRGDFGGEALEGLADELPEDEPSGEVFVPDGVVVEERFLDYGRLVMAGPERGGGARGRLSPIGPWDSVFAVGVSMQVDVVMVLVEQWVERARAIDRLSLPPRCVTVAALDQFDFRYDCAARVDVPSTGAWATVPVMECRVGLAPQYVCVPAVEPKVYRTLDIRNDTVNALLAGPVDVSVGEDFLMTTAMPAVPPGATTARLGLGVEEAIKVARKSSFTETTGGFLGGSTVLRHDV
ncbi:MAG: DUF4139 domain-containing protein, partial [Myxococcaceae bacterium]|nr:DUF4139 domain-containing protein [Myxococcaceae bacterium]